MAQMPIQSVSGRADPFAAAGPAQPSAPPRVAILRAAYIHDSAGIPGGMLRPGAIDQELFKAHLAAAQKAAMVAPPVAAGAQAFPGIPRLSPAQLAALGAVQEPGDELVIDIPAPNPADPGQGGGQPLSGKAGGGAGGTGAASSPLDTPAPDRTAPAAASGTVPGAATAPAPSGAPAPQASVARGPFPGSRRGADGVWELMRRPDKDERDLLRGQEWRVVENEQAQRLFLGPDGEFGWDDFLDLVNPLQHIPFVNMAYRAITGDEIYGAARLVDFAFGPMAGASTAIDLAFRDVTGESMASNAIAALFGPAEAPGADATSINTASGDRQHLAGAGLIRRGSNR